MKAIYNDKVKRAVELWKEVYEYNGVGGDLHIVLDDHNMSNYNIQWCLDEAIGKRESFCDGEEENYPGEVETCRELAELLLTMTMAERLSAEVHHDSRNQLRWDGEGNPPKGFSTIHMRQDLMDCYADELEAEGIVKKVCVCAVCYERPDQCSCSAADPQKVAEEEAARAKGRKELEDYFANRIRNESNSPEKEARQRRCDVCGQFFDQCECCTECKKLLRNCSCPL